jgi:hypothetical protein
LLSFWNWFEYSFLTSHFLHLLMLKYLLAPIIMFSTGNSHQCMLSSFTLSRRLSCMESSHIISITDKPLIFWHFVPQMCTQPNWLCHQSIITKQNKTRKYFLQNWLWHPSYTKIHVILLKCDNVIENIQIHMSWWVSFFGLKFCINVKNIYEKGIFNHIFLGTKKSLDLQKVNNHIVTFAYWFWFGNKILNV